MQSSNFIGYFNCEDVPNVLGSGLEGVGSQSLSFLLSDKLLLVLICQGDPEGDSEPTVIQTRVLEL